MEDTVEKLIIYDYSNKKLVPASIERFMQFRQLSVSETMVFRLLISGKRPQEIADEMNSNTSTISTFRHRALRKLGLRNDAEAVAFGMEHSLINWVDK